MSKAPGMSIFHVSGTKHVLTCVWHVILCVQKSGHVFGTCLTCVSFFGHASHKKEGPGIRKGRFLLIFSQSFWYWVRLSVSRTVWRWRWRAKHSELRRICCEFLWDSSLWLFSFLYLVSTLFCICRWHSHNIYVILYTFWFWWPNEKYAVYGSKF